MAPAGDGWRRLFVAALAALLLLELLWEIWLAPARSGSAWLALKALPLALVWPGVARGARRPAQWALLLLPWYFAEGVVRVWSESGRAALCAGTAALVALVALGAGLMWLRAQEHVR
jgi:uncharacterized membrane protein